MAERKLPVITINREYGAGGRSIARAIATRLDIPWYDHDFIQKTAENSGLPIDRIREEGEALTPGKIWMDRLFSFSPSKLYDTSQDDIFDAQKKVMVELAHKPCIIVGRCSNEIVKNAYIDVFRIFLYADEEHRLKRAIEMREYEEGTDPIKYVKKHEVFRENYHKHYTGHDFKDPDYYDVCLNTGLYTYEQAAEFLIEMITKRSEE